MIKWGIKQHKNEPIVLMDGFCFINAISFINYLMPTLWTDEEAATYLNYIIYE